MTPYQRKLQIQLERGSKHIATCTSCDTFYKRTTVSTLCRGCKGEKNKNDPAIIAKQKLEHEIDKLTKERAINFTYLDKEVINTYRYRAMEGEIKVSTYQINKLRKQWRKINEKH